MTNYREQTQKLLQRDTVKKPTQSLQTQNTYKAKTPSSNQLGDGDFVIGDIFKGVGYGLGKVVEGLATGVEGITDAVIGAGAQLVGADKWAKEKIYDKNSMDDFFKMEDVFDVKEGSWAEKGGNLLQGVGDTAVPILVGVALAAMTAGASVPISAGVAGTAAFGVKGLGQGTSYAVQKTGELGLKENLYGVGSAAMEMTIEKMSGGIGGINFVKNAGKIIPSSIAKGMIGEGFEEIISTALDPLLQRATIDKNAEFADFEDYVTSFVSGAFVSGILQGGVSLVNTRRTTNLGRDIIRSKGNEGVLEILHKAEEAGVQSKDLKLMKAQASDGSPFTAKTVGNVVQQTNSAVMEKQVAKVMKDQDLNHDKAVEYLSESMALNAKIEENNYSTITQDPAQAEVIKQAVNGGTVQPIEVYQFSELAKATNTPLNFINDVSEPRGMYNSNGTMTLNLAKGTFGTAVHETTHVIEKIEGYQDFRKVVIDMINENTYYAKLAQDTANKYRLDPRTKGMTEAEIEAEVVAEVAKEIVKNPTQFLKDVKHDKTALQKLADFFERLLEGFKNMFTSAEQQSVKNAYDLLVKAIKNAKTTQVVEVGAVETVKYDIDKSRKKSYNKQKYVQWKSEALAWVYNGKTEAGDVNHGFDSTWCYCYEAVDPDGEGRATDFRVYRRFKYGDNGKVAELINNIEELENERANSTICKNLINTWFRQKASGRNSGGLGGRSGVDGKSDISNTGQSPINRTGDIKNDVRKDEKPTKFDLDDVPLPTDKDAPPMRGRDSQDFGKDKVYLKKDVKEIVDDVLSDALVGGAYEGKLSASKLEYLFNELNGSVNKSLQERELATNRIVDYFMEEMSVKSYLVAESKDLSVEKVKAFKGYFKQFDLRSIKPELVYKYGKRKAGYIMGKFGGGKTNVYDVAIELNDHSGIIYDMDTNDSDLFIEMFEDYERQIKTIKERSNKELKAIYSKEELAKVKKSIRTSVTQAFEEGGRDGEYAKIAKEYEVAIKNNDALTKEKAADLKKRYYDKVGHFEKLTKLKIASYRKDFVTRNKIRESVKKADNSLKNIKKMQDPAKDKYFNQKKLGDLASVLSTACRTTGMSIVVDSRIKGLSALYEKVTRDLSEGRSMEFSPRVLSVLESLEEIFEGKVSDGENYSSEMIKDIDRINSVLEVFKNVETIIKNDSKLILGERTEDIRVKAEKWQSDIGEEKSKKWAGEKIDELTLLVADPAIILSSSENYSDGTAKFVFDEISKGNDKKIAFMRDNLDPFNKILKENKIKDNYAVIGAHDLSLMQRIDLYNHARVANNKKVAMKYGFSYMDKNKKKRSFKPTEEHFEKISKSLTASEKQLADYMYEFVNGNGKIAINETSVLLQGVERAVVKDYWTLNRDGFQKELVLGVYESSLNQGFLSARKENALPIKAKDNLLWFNSMVENVSDYYGLAIPIRNAEKLLGYKRWSIDNEMLDPSNLSTIDKIKAVKGEHVATGITKWLRDLKGFKEERADIISRAVRTGRRGVQLSAIAGNLKVLANQFIGVVAGFEKLPAKYYLKNRPLSELKKVLSYSAQAWLRNQGYTSFDAIEATKFDKFNKFKNAFTVGIQKTDNLVVKMMWNASLNKMEEKGFKGEELYVKAGEYLNDVLATTQPTYDTVHTPQIYRNSNNEVLKTFGMFKGDQFKLLSRMYEAFYRKNKKAMAQIFGTMLASSAGVVALSMLFNQLRGRENKEDFATLMASSMVGHIPLIGDVFDYALFGYDINSMGFDALNDIGDVFTKSSDIIESMFKPNGEPIEFKDFYQVVEKLATVSGVPLRNMKNMTEIAFNAFASGSDAQVSFGQIVGRDYEVGNINTAVNKAFPMKKLKYNGFKKEIMSIKSDIDKNGETIAGSQKEKRIKAVLANNEFDSAQKLLIIKLLGYTIKEGDVPGISSHGAKRKIVEYLKTLDLSREEKVIILTKCGYTVLSDGTVK